MVETQHAAGLPKLAMPSQRSAALFAARLRIARSETPGWRILCSSPASFAGRLDLISDGERQFSRPARSRTRFRNNVTLGCTTGLFSTVPQRRGTALGRMLSSQELILGSLVACASLPAQPLL